MVLSTVLNRTWVPVLASVTILAAAQQAPAQLSGTRTIGGTSPDYPTLQAAVTALASGGVSGPVVFNIRNGIYAEKVVIPPITGTSISNTITFQSESGRAADVTIQHDGGDAIKNYVIKDSGAAHLRFRRLTLASTGVSTTYRRVVELAGNVDDVQFEGNTLRGVLTTSSTVDLAVMFARNAQLSRFELRQNTFLNGSYGAFLSSPVAGPAQHTVIRGNGFNNSTGWGGLFLQYHTAPVVDSNTVAADYIGIDVESCANGLQVTRNRVTCNKTAIYLWLCAGNPEFRGIVANNFVLVGGNYFSTYGIRLQSSSYIGVYHNTVNVTMTRTPSSALTLGQGSGQTVNVQNNILLNTGGGLAYDAGNVQDVGISNHNILYTSGPVLASWVGVSESTLVDLRAVSGKDLQSAQRNVSFASPTDLHLAGSSIGDPTLAGESIGAVPIDIDGEPRNIFSPYIGADEITLSPLAVAERGATVPQTWSLAQNFPNPFNPSTTIQFSLLHSAAVRLAVFNAVGQQVAELINEPLEAGSYSVRFNGAGLASGIYFYRITAGSFVSIRSMVLLK